MGSSHWLLLVRLIVEIVEDLGEEEWDTKQAGARDVIIYMSHAVELIQ